MEPLADDAEFLPGPGALGQHGVSNCDGEIPPELDGLLRARPGACAAHWAWDHWGRIWFADGKFHEEVMVYGTTRAIISADTLPELIDDVNDRFGDG
jgi:hypothetical protein